ncbi:MAG: hypothetical protein AAF623_06910 [Planctomycetota bacterium]
MSKLNQRRGVTLLFVVSMLVLFLLMGTTFVVLANDYFRQARRRGVRKIHRLDNTAYVHRSFYNLVRGPELENINSPLRGHDLLSDMYGYGLKASIRKAELVNTTRGQLIRIELAEQTTINNGFNVSGLRSMLADAQAKAANIQLPGDLVGGDFDTAAARFTYTDPNKNYLFNPGKTSLSPLDVPGYFGGQVMSFVDGQAKGVSARIIDYSVAADIDADNLAAGVPTVVRTFLIMPEVPSDGIDSPFDNETVTLRDASGTGTINTSEVQLLGEVFDGTVLLNAPSTVIINGKPFGGYGAGVVFAGGGRVPGAVTRNGNNYQLANRPNHARFEGWDVWSTATNPDTFFTEYGQFSNSFNEPYDAFDADNVMLAQVLPTGITAASFNPTHLSPKHLAQNRVGTADVPANMYSFRPVLQWTTDDLTQPTSMNSSTANRNFPNIWYSAQTPPTDFSNLADWALPINPGDVPHEPQSRPLDVDNDGDGIADSVWMDVGHGIIITPDGRRVKPLVAAMVVDLDSRLNINTHGNIAEAVANEFARFNGNNFEPARMFTQDLLGGDPFTAANSINLAAMARGYGLGPAEISLAPLVKGGFENYTPLLMGAPGFDPSVGTFPLDYPIVPGRYGFDRYPGAPSLDVNAAFRFQDHPSTGVAGLAYSNRPFDMLGRFAVGFPRFYENANPANANFANQGIPDLIDPTVMVKAPVGMPTADIASSTWPPQGPDFQTPAQGYPTAASDLYNSPYESSLYRRTDQRFDALFSPDELEALLRPFDIDSRLLNDRLYQLGLQASLHRNMVTTESWEVPALPPADYTITERLYEILTANITMTHNEAFVHINGFTSINTGTETVQYYQSLLAPEILRGLPMNVNRIFGDSRLDNDGDGIFDEHWDSTSPVLNEALSESMPLSTPAIAIDHNNDGYSDREDRFARQHFARHLFVLTWLTAGGDFTPGSAPSFKNPIPPDMDGNQGTTDEDYWKDIELLAQWCINVVDFRDADSICTPFEFDYNPWDGWDGAASQVNLVNSNRADNSYADTFNILNSMLTFQPGQRTNFPAYEKMGNRGLVWGMEKPELLITEAMATHERRYEDHDTSDPEYESRLVPKASVFVELYNPWLTNANTDVKPAEFYSGGGVNLAAQTRAIGSAGPDPIWRMSFTETRASDPDNNDSRRVYFLEPSSDVEPNDNGNWYFPDDSGGGGSPAIVVNPIQPGNYGVVGSSGINDGGNFTTYFGRRSDLTGATPVNINDLQLDDTRSINLIPGTGIELNDYYEDHTGTIQNETRTQGCVAIPINRRGRVDLNLERSLGISDPTEGYGSLGGGTTEFLDSMGETDGDRFLAPLDYQADAATTLTFPRMRRDASAALDNDAVFYDGVTPGARYLLLQRLANPEAPFDADFNPYITVDSAPVDLLSFNGIVPTSDPSINANSNGWLANSRLDTHERGEAEVNIRRLWREAPNPRTNAADVTPINSGAQVRTRGDDLAGADDHFLSHEFVESFGLMNEADRYTRATAENLPFSWYTWNNRPYVSQFELGLVTPYRAGAGIHPEANPTGGGAPDFNIINEADGDEEFDRSLTENRDAMQIASALGKFDGAANHLVPFNGTRLKNVFDYLEVPPRHINSEIGFSVQRFNGEPKALPNFNNIDNPLGRPGGAAGTQEGRPTVFNAPHNYASRYRYPGRLNLNTLTDQEIWTNGVMRFWGYNAGHLGNIIGRVRSTDDATSSAELGGLNRTANLNQPDTANYYAVDAANPVFTIPTREAVDPIRPSGIGEFFVERAVDPETQTLLEGENDSTILRANTTTPANAGLLRNQGGVTSNGYEPASRDYAFALAPISKLANTTTERSSVFAIWITVGYFEVDDNGRLGAEVGSEVGEIVRNKGFYIYDRSIPVAYEPGKNHNVERGILVQSIIE